MASLNHMFLGILILQIYVHAIPMDVGKLKDIAQVEQADAEAESPAKESEDSGSADTPRQKRFYNPYGYGFPPFSPLIYPSYNGRDDFSNTGTFGVDSPLTQIHKRVQEIANIVRQPAVPQIPHVPIFYPVLFIPPFDCGCNPTETGPSTPDSNQPAPNVTTRFPEMEDTRQNWGFVINETGEDNNAPAEEEGQDFARPISFDPIRLNRPNARPPPPVEHGTVQEDANSIQRPQSGESASAAPPPPNNNAPPSQPPFNAPRPPPPPPPRNPGPAPAGPPSPCDGAILTCCHQPQVIYDCFAIQGCPNFTPYGNPCETNSILRVIEKFQRFYGSKNS